MSASPDGGTPWQDTFDLGKCTHLTEGANRFFILKPGYQIVLASETEQVVIEVAPGVAMDRAEIVSDSETLEMPDRHRLVGVKQKYKGCLKVIETSPLEPGDECVKLYAPDVGMVFDDGLIIVERGFNRVSPKAPIVVKADLSSTYSEVEIKAEDMPKAVVTKIQELHPTVHYDDTPIP